MHFSEGIPFVGKQAIISCKANPMKDVQVFTVAQSGETDEWLEGHISVEDFWKATFSWEASYQFFSLFQVAWTTKKREKKF